MDKELIDKLNRVPPDMTEQVRRNLPDTRTHKSMHFSITLARPTPINFELLKSDATPCYKVVPTARFDFVLRRWTNGWTATWVWTLVDVTFNGEWPELPLEPSND